MQTDVSSNVASDMDPHLLNFLRDKVNTFVKWDLVRFFHDNPHTADTAENIARYTGRDIPTVKRELDDLVQAGVLEASTPSNFEVYALVHDQEVRDLIRQFILACDDRQFRVDAMYYVLRGTQ